MKNVYIVSILLLLCFYGCKGDSDDEKNQPSPPKILYNIDGNFIRQGSGITGQIVYNIDGDSIRQGESLTGKVTFLRKGEFVYQGSEVKGKPLYCLISDNICLYATFQNVFRKSGRNLYKGEGYSTPPTGYYAGEVAFNIDGEYLRQGRSSTGSVMFTKSGNYYHQGKGTRGSIAFNRDGNYIRLGSKTTGAIIFTIKNDLLYKARSNSIVSYNIDGNFIRKGRAKQSIEGN